MSEKYNPQGGVPNPYGNSESAPQRPTYSDPNHSSNGSPPELIFTGHPGGGMSPYPPGQNWGVIKQKEANTKAMFALVFGIVSFFFLGLLLSIPGYFMARQAEQVNGQYAKAARIVNLISIGFYTFIGIFCLVVFSISLAGYHTSW